MGHDSTKELVANHRITSDQVSAAQIETVLTELDKALQLNPAGDVVEFGCYVGTTSLFIRRLLDMRREDRAFHVYDSFAGLPNKTLHDQSPAGSQFQAGELATTKKQFVREFQKADLQPPVIHKGWFNQLQSSDLPDQICFAFLDGDFYESIRDSLLLVLPRLTPQATLVIDDYAREALPGAARAVHDCAPQFAQKLTVSHNMGVIRLY